MKTHKILLELIDLKVSAFFGAFLTISQTDLDFSMTMIAFFLTVGYTARRWYLLETKNKED
jgi:hypothetical protein